MPGSGETWVRTGSLPNRANLTPYFEVNLRSPSIPLDSLGEIAALSPRDEESCELAKQVDLLQGTLEMLILKAVSLGKLHGYGILLRIQQFSGEQLVIQQGSLYPALYRLEHEGGASKVSGARAKTIAAPSITVFTADCR